MATATHKAKPGLEDSVEWLENLDNVRKVIVAHLTACGHKGVATGHLKLAEETPQGFRLRGYDNEGVVNLYVLLGNTDQEARRKFQHEIHLRFPKHRKLLRTQLAERIRPMKSHIKKETIKIVQQDDLPVLTWEAVIERIEKKGGIIANPHHPTPKRWYFDRVEDSGRILFTDEDGQRRWLSLRGQRLKPTTDGFTMAAFRTPNGIEKNQEYRFAFSINHLRGPTAPMEASQISLVPFVPSSPEEPPEPVQVVSEPIPSPVSVEVKLPRLEPELPDIWENIEGLNKFPLRGTYLFLLDSKFLPGDPSPRYALVTWKGEAYTIRDYIRGKRRGVGPDLTIKQLWDVAKDRIQVKTKDFAKVEDVKYWPPKCTELTEEWKKRVVQPV